MTEDDISIGEHALVFAGKALVGAPAAVISNAVKVVSRLVGAVGSIPEAWVKGKTQAIKDDADARSTIVKAVAKSAAKQAAADPAIIDRSLERWVGDLVQHQHNRETIAAITVHELKKVADSALSDDAPTSGTKTESDVDDDWLNAFSRFAGNASTDRMQRLWARVAAGEIRKPGSFSLSTLRLVSEIDQATAKDFEKAFAYVIGDCIPVDLAWQNELYTLALRMQARGLFLNPPNQASRKFEVAENGHGFFIGTHHAVVVKAPPGVMREVQIIVLSQAALELATLLTPANEVDNLKKLALSLEKSDLETVSVRPIKFDGNVATTTGPGIQVWPELRVYNASVKDISF